MKHVFVIAFLLLAIQKNFAQSAIKSVKLLRTQIPASIKYKGSFTEAWKWKDSLGENILVLSETKIIRDTSGGASEDNLKKEIFAGHYINKSKQWKLLWRLNDFVKECGFDLTAEFLKSSVSITDLDKDGIAETTVQYKLACRSDVSPASMKLIMHEDSLKFALRGSMYLEIDKPVNDLKDQNLDLSKQTAVKDEWEQITKQWGRYENESDFTKAPPEFILHARKRWLKFAKEKF